MDITMKLEPYGWLDIWVSTSTGTEIEIPASFISDSICEIANKMAGLENAWKEKTINIQTEPGEYRLKMVQTSELTCRFQIFEMRENFSSEDTKQGILLVTENIQLIRLARMIYRELTKMKNLGDAEYRARWGNEFPIEYYNKIEKTIKKLKAMEKIY